MIATPNFRRKDEVLKENHRLSIFHCEWYRIRNFHKFIEVHSRNQQLTFKVFSADSLWVFLWFSRHNTFIHIWVISKCPSSPFLKLLRNILKFFVLLFRRIFDDSDVVIFHRTIISKTNCKFCGKSPSPSLLKHWSIMKFPF